jgi:hypothetical protein
MFPSLPNTHHEKRRDGRNAKQRSQPQCSSAEIIQQQPEQ